MEFIIALVVIVAVGSLVYFNRSSKSLDINNDGKVDLEDAKTAVDNTVTGITAVVEESKATVKKAATKRSAAKKSTANKSK